MAKVIIFGILCLILSQIKSSSVSSSYITQFAANFIKDYIINGGFQNPHSNSCDFFSVVPGWPATGQIQMGIGSSYNPLWRSQIAQLDSRENIRITQTLTLPSKSSGVCLIKCQYAARSYQPLITSQMNIYMNGRLIKHVLPTSYDIVYDEIYAPCFPGTNYLTFEGAGPSDMFGMAIDNVEFYPILKLQKRSPIYYLTNRHPNKLRVDDSSD